MNRQALINLAGGQDKAQAALDALIKARPDLAAVFNAAPDSAQADVILEMAVRQAKAKAPVQQKRNPFANFSNKEIVTNKPAQSTSGITAREYAESLQALRKSKEWDGENYEHPKVKELSARMLQSMDSFRQGRADPNKVKQSQSGHYDGLNLNTL